MTFLMLLALLAIVWLLWRIARHTGDALDRQAAIQVELAALNRRLEAVERTLGPTAGAREK